MAEAFETVPLETEIDPADPYLSDLLPALQWLDRRLERAVAAAQVAYGPQAVDDPYRGLYLNHDEMVRLLAREPGAPTLRPEGESQFDSEKGDRLSGKPFAFIERWFSRRSTPSESTSEADEPSRPEMDATIADPGDEPSPVIGAPGEPGPDSVLPPAALNDTALGWLAQTFGLSAFDLALLIITLAPELDLRYERLYAYLQDDVSRRRPSVDLTLNLLCPSAEAKLLRRTHFGPEAPLIHHKLISLIPDPGQVQPPLLAYALKLDERIIRLLLGQPGLDPRLEPFGQLIDPAGRADQRLVSPELVQALQMLVAQAIETDEPLRLYFNGLRGTGKRTTAIALAAEVGVPLLVANLEEILATDIEFEIAVERLLREAWFQAALVYLDGLDALHNDERAIYYDQLLVRLAGASGLVILAGTQPWTPPGRSLTGMVSIPFLIPDYTRRRIYWQSCLHEAGATLAEPEVDALANHFRLTPHQIADAVATAHKQAQWQAVTLAGPDGPDERSSQVTLSDLFTAARAQSGHDLAALAYKIEPRYRWGDIVLPPDQLAQLREICNQATFRHVVYGGWGFDRKLSLGKGLNVLFSGPPGTGKTMAAEIIATELQLDLYKIDLSQVVSKYIGETEKNLDRIFNAAENANAILFFDEADALFGKRSEVRDSHDRYANIEISYLLQKMEQYEGVAILATNLRRNLDEAFVRRLAFTVHFPFPDDDSRRRIWSGIWPAETPLGEEVDFDFLARQFKLSGGNIKNIALAAAFLAAANGRSVMMTHLIQATRREYQKLGKPCTEAEFGSYFFLIREPEGAP